MQRASLFIGSSTAGIRVAQSIRSQLKADAEITIWHEGIFGLGVGTLEALLSSLDRFDFAVLVLTPDDLISSESISAQSPRDNVLFECGLFMGRLGRFRTFIVYDSDVQLKIPSDLAGITVATYRGNRRDNNLLAALGEACDPIRTAINELGPLQKLERAPIPGVAHSDPSLSGRPQRHTVWFLGSAVGLEPAEEKFVHKMVSMLADGLAHAGIRVVVGESDLLIELAKCYRDTSIGANLEVPNPIILAGNLRPTDLRLRFVDTIGIVPDLGVIIGGNVERGRVAEEHACATAAGIPVLPIPITGGYARVAQRTAMIAASDQALLDRDLTRVDVGDVAGAVLRAIRFSVTTP